METTHNGWYKSDDGKRHLSNAHLSYKGRSIIIDYEWCLHSYDLDGEIKKKELKDLFLLKFILMVIAFIQDMFTLIVNIRKQILVN